MISVILLAGGKGTRMKSALPKQFLLLKGQPIALYSFNLLIEHPEVTEIVVVCDPAYHHLFKSLKKTLRFADPGERRQDSVYNGLQQVSTTSSFVCIHDSARPLIHKDFIEKAFYEAYTLGASAVGVPVKNTLKLSDTLGFVKETLDRTHVWEMQTPQVIKKDWLIEAFTYVNAHQLTVTDDASLIELLGKPVKLVYGAYTNIKITTPDDLIFAEMLLR